MLLSSNKEGLFLQIAKGTVLSALLIVLVAIEGLAFAGVQSEYDELNRESATLRILYTELNTSYHLLNTSYLSLALEYAALRGDHDSLQDQYADLNESYALLEADSAALESRYTDLSQSYAQLEADREYLSNLYSELSKDLEVEQTLNIGNSLESYYDLVRDEEGFMGTWYGDQRDANFCAKLALHDLGCNSWPSLENRFYEDVKKHSYEMAREKMDAVIEFAEVNSYDSATEKIEKILRFLSDHIRYELEVNNVYLAPTEALGFRSGDCDDFSILGAALFEAAGVDAAIGLFRNQYNDYHSMVLVHLDGLEGYGYWKFDDLTDKGLAEGRWIVIEPQYTIGNQGDDWIQQWELLYAAPIG